MSKHLRLKMLLDKLAPVSHKAQDQANPDLTEWLRSMRTCMPWILWFGVPGAHVPVLYIRPRLPAHVRSRAIKKFAR
jgi:hypothetical protein